MRNLFLLLFVVLGIAYSTLMYQRIEQLEQEARVADQISEARSINAAVYTVYEHCLNQRALLDPDVQTKVVCPVPTPVEIPEQYR